MSRKCSHCSLHGHNSRTCLDRGGFKLFGVHLNEPPPVSPAMRKCFSTGNLFSYASAEDPQLQPQPDMGPSLDGYASDDLVHANSIARERKKGVPWTEEEHRLFLLGLQKLGKGDWRGISKKFVKTRTPTQVASHAQKYFLRRGNLVKRRRRSSLFDITPDTVSSLFAQEEPAFEEAAREGTDVFQHIHQSSGAHELAVGDCRIVETTGITRHGIPAIRFNKPSTRLSLSCTPAKVFEMEEAGAAEESAELGEMEMAESSDLPFFEATASIPAIPSVAGCNDVGTLPNHACLFFPVLFPLWCERLPESFEQKGSLSFKSKIVRPTPIIRAAPVRIDESLKISEPSFGMARPVMQPTALSLKLLEEGSRHSAFQAMPSLGGSRLDTRGNLNSAISVA